MGHLFDIGANDNGRGRPTTSTECVENARQHLPSDDSLAGKTLNFRQIAVGEEPLNLPGLATQQCGYIGG
jgi:hypothetical protein